MSAALRTEADLAVMFDATERRIAEWRRIYNWPCTRVGRTIRFTDAQVEMILASHEHRPAAEPVVTVVGQTTRSARRSG